MIPHRLILAAAGALLAACGSSPTKEPTAATVGSPAADASATANTVPSSTQPTPDMSNVYTLSPTSLAGKPADLSSYQGKVTLIVNVASECGYTPQYAGLQKLHADLAPRGFAVLGFPSNEFGGQEPGSPEQIQQFCTSKYSVSFPMFAKCETKPGAGQSPVFAALAAGTGKSPNWNFCKYLVGKDGKVIAFFPSKVAPDAAELRTAIDKAML